jgi:hypothetical protein
MSRDWSGGSTRRWRRIRAAVLRANLAENAGRCRLAVPGVCSGPADQVHHTRGKAYGDDPRYLTPACGPCNRHVGNPAARAAPQPRRVSSW